MALKALLLRNKIDSKKTELEALRAKDADFERRETELETAINEMTEETPEEDRITVELEVENFNDSKDEHERSKKALEDEIAGLEEELNGIEEAQRAITKPVVPEKRGDDNIMETRKFFGMNAQERDAFFAREDVKEFLTKARELGSQNRAVKGSEFIIPETVFGLIKENITEFSKLYKHVNVKSVKGTARQPIMGLVPEAVWTEMCGKINELDFSFGVAEVDGYKVGGYVAICNAVLEDNDVSLATEIISGIGHAIGRALDKAILYGTGTKMPLGIVTRLAQSAAPSGEEETWTDLTSHVVAFTSKTDVALFKSIIETMGLADNKYSTGDLFFAMNNTTYTKLLSNSLSINSAGAIVAGVNKTMPVIGGSIEIINDIPDDVIIGGYGDMYLLAERAGAKLSQSEHVQFIEDNTVFKGTARYDGIPVIPGAFVAMGISGAKPTATAVTFAEDKANKGEE